MISLAQAALLKNLSTRRLRVLCAQGRIQGAKRVGYSWIVPTNCVIKPPKERK
jgi:hypothetical protein